MDSPQRGGGPGAGIRIEKPHAGTTDLGVQPLAGRVFNGLAKGVIVSLNGDEQIMDVWEKKFEGEVALRPGKNQIRVKATGARGILGEDTVEVQYVPPAPSPAIKIVQPADGTVLDPSTQDEVAVEGIVTEPVMNPGRVVFNGFTVPVGVRDGRFTTHVPLIGPEMEIWAEMRGGGGTRRSLPISIRTQSAKPARPYILLHLPSRATKVDARVWLAHRPNPADINGPRKVTMVSPAGAGAGQTLLFPVRQTAAGAYALALDYRFPPGDGVERGWGLIFVPGASGYRALRLGPFILDGKGRATLAKFLLPQGVFWDEDSWFNGTAEGAESVTKFRYADGVSWAERKGEPDFSNGR
jgi:hypothetical protein